MGSLSWIGKANTVGYIYHSALRVKRFMINRRNGEVNMIDFYFASAIGIIPLSCPGLVSL